MFFWFFADVAGDAPPGGGRGLVVVVVAEIDQQVAAQQGLRPVHLRRGSVPCRRSQAPALLVLGPLIPPKASWPFRALQDLLPWTLGAPDGSERRLWADGSNPRRLLAGASDRQTSTCTHKHRERTCAPKPADLYGLMDV